MKKLTVPTIRHKKLYLPLLLSSACMPLGAVDFTDDFSNNTVNPPVTLYSDHINEADSVISYADSGLDLTIIHRDPTGDERAIYEIQPVANPDFLSATGQIVGARPTNGSLRYEIFGEFFNRTVDGGPEPGERTDNVEIEITLRVGTTPEEDGLSYCFKYRDSESNSQPVLASGEKCFGFETVVDISTEFTLGVGIDRNTQELIASVNDEVIREPSPYPFYKTSEDNDRYYARVRVRDGAAEGQFRISNLTADGEILDLSGLTEPPRYKTDGFDNFDNDDDRSKDIVDGRLRLTATVTDSEEENQAFLRFSEPNDYIEADLMYSSESSIATGNNGFAAVRIAGGLFNDRTADLDAGSAGDVWGSVMLIKNANAELVGQYCLIRADLDDWSVSTDLADQMDDDRCPTFDLAIEADQYYNAKMKLDQEAKTVTFELGGEVKTINIDSPIYKQDDLLRLQSRIARGATGTVVGYFDNLTNAAAVASDAADNTGDADTTANDPASEIGSSSGGGGSAGWFFLALAAVGVKRRMRKWAVR